MNGHSQRANDGAVTQIASIESFQVLDGRITRVWNAAYSPGPWA